LEIDIWEASNPVELLPPKMPGKILLPAVVCINDQTSVITVLKIAFVTGVNQATTCMFNVPKLLTVGRSLYSFLSFWFMKTKR
jgi:hypothetical protein